MSDIPRNELTEEQNAKITKILQENKDAQAASATLGKSGVTIEQKARIDAVVAQARKENATQEAPGQPGTSERSTAGQATQLGNAKTQARESVASIQSFTQDQRLQDASVPRGVDVNVALQVQRARTHGSTKPINNNAPDLGGLEDDLQNVNDLKAREWTYDSIHKDLYKEK